MIGTQSTLRIVNAVRIPSHLPRSIAMETDSMLPVMAIPDMTSSSYKERSGRAQVAKRAFLCQAFSQTQTTLAMFGQPSAASTPSQQTA